MGQEAEYEQRMRDFKGYQVTEELCREGGANPDWKFMHCLPRKKHEVDDEVILRISSNYQNTQLMPFWRSFTVLVPSCSLKLTTGNGLSWPCLSA